MCRILALSLVLFVTTIDGKVFRSDYVFNDVAEVWTKYHTMPAKWDEARLHCFYEGSTLLSPISMRLLNVMKKVKTNSTLPAFTGFSSTHFNGDYYSVEGIPFEKVETMMQWAPGEPNNSGNEQCIAIHPNGALEDVQCNKPHPFVCYKQHTQDMNTIPSGCGTVDPEYHYDGRTGQCYKVHKFAQTWNRAFLACSAEGGYLAIINSEIEAQVLKDLMAEFPSEGDDIPSGFGIGFQDWSEHGVFMTIHGETLQEAGYDVWGDGQPDNWGGDDGLSGEYCGAVFRDGRLNDVRCNLTIPFICEMPPITLVRLFELNSSGQDDIDSRFQN